jgi:hypothetical protein
MCVCVGRGGKTVVWYGRSHFRRGAVVHSLD